MSTLKPSRSYITFQLVLLVAGWATLPASAQEVALFNDGVSEYRLVLPEDPVPDEVLAAEELRHYLALMSGAELSDTETQAGGPKLYLGRPSAFPLAPVEGSELGAEAYLIEGRGKDLYLLGGSARAVLWAVYGLLHELGCRWYMPGEIGEVVPKQSTIVVDGQRRVSSPDFPYRQIWYSWGGPADGGKRFAVWQRRNRLARPLVQHGHNLTNSMPDEASFEKRPELYALVEGRRTKSQVCTTDPEVVRMITDTVNAYFDANPEVLCYSLCPDDNRDFCECDRCRALDTGAVDPDSQKPIVTDRYVTFLNQVAEGVQGRHPGKMVSMYAYVNHSTPPARTSISPYVVVFFTSSVYCGGHGVGDPICASRMEMKTDLSAWAKACENVYIYEYDPIPGNAELPWPLFGARAREMPLYQDMGIKGLSMEAHCSWATLSPNHWVTAQCLWDAEQDADDLLRDYCGRFFGLSDETVAPDVAEAMYAFYQTLEHALARHAPKIEWGQRDIPDLFTPDAVEKCRTALNRALALAKKTDAPEKSVVLERLHMVDLGFRYLEQYLVCRRLASTGGDYETYRKAYDACGSLLDEMVATNTDYVEVHSAYPGIRDGLGDVLAMQFPEELGLVTTWQAIGPFDNADGNGHDSVYPLETELDLNAEYDGLAGKVRWKVISTPQGRGYVDLLNHFAPKDWVTVYLLAYVHCERDTEAQLRLGSNDTVKVWLGGELVWHYDQGRKAVFDEDIVPVRIKAGVTPVLLKVSQMGLNWGFYFRICDDAGEQLPGVTVTTCQTEGVPFDPKEYAGDSFRVSTKTHKHGDALIRLNQVKRGPPSASPPHCCRAWLTVENNGRKTWASYWDDMDPGGAEYGLFVPKTQPSPEYYAVVKCGDYDGRLFLINRQGVVREMIGGFYFVSKDGRYLFSEYYSDLAGFAVFDLERGDLVFSSTEVLPIHQWYEDGGVYFFTESHWPAGGDGRAVENMGKVYVYDFAEKRVAVRDAGETELANARPVPYDFDPRDYANCTCGQ